MQTNELYRPKLHYTAKNGWINDPNGFSVYKGKFHLFAQHNPHDTKWGPMHWSHAVSDDLIKWEHKPIALTPTENYELDLGCFSGSAIEHDGKHILMYTGCKGVAGESTHQTQCIAVGDGTDYTKSQKNPVINAQDLPEFVKPSDFRDPKIFKTGDYFYALMGAQVYEKNIGTMLLYRSRDLEKWEYVGETLRAQEDGLMGIVFECPDIFKLGDKHIILTSPINMPTQGNKYQNLSSAIYFVGEMDFESGKFTPEYYDEIDSGFDFYAPQTTLNTQGKRVMIAWAQMWGRNFITDQLGHGWVGCMSMPRELILEKNRLLQTPIKALERYYNGRYSNIDEGNVDCFRLNISVDLTSGNNFCLKLFKTSSGCLKIFYDRPTNTLSLDRSQSLYRLDKDPKEAEVKNVRRVELLPLATLKLDIIVDTSLVEVFINDGRHTMTANYYKGNGDVTNEINTDCKYCLDKFDFNIN